MAVIHPVMLHEYDNNDQRQGQQHIYKAVMLEYLLHLHHAFIHRHMHQPPQILLIFCIQLKGQLPPHVIIRQIHQMPAIAINMAIPPKILSVIQKLAVKINPHSLIPGNKK